MRALFDATGLTRAAAWLEDSPAAGAAKVAAVAAALAAAAAAARLGDAGAGAAAARAAGAATAAALALAGPPAALQLAYALTSLDTHALMGLAAAGAAAGWHPLEAALLLVLFQSSHALEHALSARARGSLAALRASMPEAATLVELGADGAPDLATARRVAAAGVAIGSILLVRPGEAVPLDGVVAHGAALVSAEHITGESLPALARAGDALPAGALVRDGALAVRATATAAGSTPARVARLAAAARASTPLAPGTERRSSSARSPRSRRCSRRACRCAAAPPRAAAARSTARWRS